MAFGKLQKEIGAYADQKINDDECAENRGGAGEVMLEPRLVQSILKARKEPLESCIEYDPKEEW